MARKTSKKTGRKSSSVLRKRGTSKRAKATGGSALSQRNRRKKTSRSTGSKASRVMRDKRFGAGSKSAAGSALSQRKAGRGKGAPKTERNKGKPWTDKDMKQLRKLAKEHAPARVIGVKLGRTESSVYAKANREGISLSK